LYVLNNLQNIVLWHWLIEYALVNLVNLICPILTFYILKFIDAFILSFILSPFHSFIYSFMIFLQHLSFQLVYFSIPSVLQGELFYFLNLFLIFFKCWHFWTFSGFSSFYVLYFLHCLHVLPNTQYNCITGKPQF